MWQFRHSILVVYREVQYFWPKSRLLSKVDRAPERRSQKWLVRASVSPIISWQTVLKDDGVPSGALQRRRTQRCRGTCRVPHASCSHGGTHVPEDVQEATAATILAYRLTEFSARQSWARETGGR